MGLASGVNREVGHEVDGLSSWEPTLGGEGEVLDRISAIMNDLMPADGLEEQCRTSGVGVVRWCGDLGYWWSRNFMAVVDLELGVKGGVTGDCARWGSSGLELVKSGLRGLERGVGGVRDVDGVRGLGGGVYPLDLVSYGELVSDLGEILE